MSKFPLFLFVTLLCHWVAGARAADAPPRQPHVFFLIGESEYHTRDTVPAFAHAELEPRGVHCDFSIPPDDESNDFPNIAALKDADVLFISVRRHTPTQEVMDTIRAHIAAGKPVVGIRTASHAFALRAKPGQPAPQPPEGHAVWPDFDHEILGGNYNDHYGKGIETWAKVLPEAAQHPVVAGIGLEEFRVPSHLYKNTGLMPWVTPLLSARLANRPEVEPIAWVSTKDNRRVFYTSLGSPEDFQVPQFRKLLTNGIFWALDKPVPAPTPKSAQVEKKTGRTNAAALTPAESAKAFDVAKGLVLEQVLAEPEVIKPLFVNFDERGRMWVVEYRQYPEPAGLKVLSHDSFWRAVYDKVPPAPPHQVKGQDRITIHESTKGDGVYDKHTTFLDGLNICTAVERGRGGVWVMNPPYLLFYPDKNNDDIPDGDPVVHLAGFGLEDTHAVANSLRWGPDGWLYGAQGSTVTAKITRPGLDEKPVAEIEGQAIWRYQPETRRFEVYGEGGGNTFGVEIDAKGRVFSGHNGGDTRGFHYMQGAYLRKGFDKHGPLSNPYTFGYFDAMGSEKTERFSHNFVIYEGNRLGAEYAGKLLGIEPLQGRVVDSEITPDGSTFKTHDLLRPVVTRDPWFRPVDIKAGPDGALYLCDWYVPQLTHSRTYSDLQEGPLDMAHGRVYRLRAENAQPVNVVDYGKLTSAQLVEQLHSDNKWVRQTVQRLLADRRDASILTDLRQKLDAAAGQDALELLWALHGSGGLDEASALHCLDHRDAFVRSWTARLLGDDNQVSPAVAQKLATVAEHEPDVEARAQLACTAKRLPAKEDLGIVRGLLNYDEDATDKRLPLLAWWAIEAKADSDRDAVLALFKDSPLWDRAVVRQHLLERVMRRFAQTGARKDLLTCATLFDLSPTPDHAKALMKGFEEAFKGRPLSGLPDELVTAMRRQGVGSVALSLRQGDAGAVESALKVLADEKAPAQTRLEYVTILGEVKAPASVPVLLHLAETTKDVTLLKAALAALAPYDDETIAPRVVALFPKLDKGAQAAALSLLGSRAKSASLLVAAVENNQIPRTAVPLEMVRKIKLFTTDDLSARSEKLWGSAGRETTAEMAKKIQHYAEILRSGSSGDPYAGHTVFMGICGACHTLHGQGGQVGPDLTKFKRDDLDTLLLNIVNPNAEIREGYESFMVTTKDGRIVTGFLVEQDPQIVVLRGLDGQNIPIARADLQEMKASGVSLMPEGLLDVFSEQQLRDLFAYLRITQPLVFTKEGLPQGQP